MRAGLRCQGNPAVTHRVRCQRGAGQGGSESSARHGRPFDVGRLTTSSRTSARRTYTLDKRSHRTAVTSTSGAAGSETVAGLTLMGSRLHNPATGRFPSPDPVQGGNVNPYAYPADPVNAMVSGVLGFAAYWWTDRGGHGHTTEGAVRRPSWVTETRRQDLSGLQ
ncbi:RHS repeat-associated core domain-containing protein [Streptomyces sp. NTH33]|uniref:RHS repeat-associated core domain-containing protein n=1 Tax=Streptomyces sp. NTH33 TaxID=1735453 RepID=UPI000DA936FE